MFFIGQIKGCLMLSSSRLRRVPAVGACVATILAVLTGTALAALPSAAHAATPTTLSTIKSAKIKPATIEPALSGANRTSPPFDECPAVGSDTSCGVLFVINADGSVSVLTDSSQPPFDTPPVEDTLIGVLNESGFPIPSLTLASTDDAFGFDGDGICSASTTPEAPGCRFATTSSGYEGPDNTFSVVDDNHGTVNFTGGGLPSGQSTYFGLEGNVTPQSLEFPLAAQPVAVTATEGHSFSGPVATFVDSDASDPNDSAANDTATIDWGDGTTSAGTITANGGGHFTVSGTHTYADEGSPTIKVSVSDPDDPGGPAKTSAPATVLDAALAATNGTPLSGIEAQVTRGTVATFTDGNPGATSADFTSGGGSTTINWGDGQSSAGTVTRTGPGQFTVTGSHAYAHGGNFTIGVQIVDDGGSTATAADSASIVIPTTLTYTGGTTGDFDDPATLAARLTDSNYGTPIANQPISLRLDSQSACTATTDANGVGQCSVIPAEPAGTVQVTGTFAGTPLFLPSSATVNFAVTKEETALSYTGDTHVANGTPAHLSGVLTEDGVTPIAGRQVVFTIGSGASAQTCTATSGANGNASCTIASVNQPLTAAGTVPVTAVFAGDQFYLPSSASATLLLQFLTGRAFGLSANINLVLLNLTVPATPDTGQVRTANAGSTTTPCTAHLGALAVINANVLCANVTTTLAPGTSTATSSVADVTIGIPGLPVITATAVKATSTTTCTASSGTTKITSLTIGGVPVNVSVGPNTTVDVAGLAKLVINEQLPVAGADKGLTVNALHLTGLGGAVDVVVASATSDAHNC